MKVLVVDDDPAARDFTCDVLMGGGFNVSEAEDGSAALAKVAQSIPDCIVLDLVMPGLSGFDTLREMRKVHAKMPPVVVLTTMDGGGTKVYATKVNKADAFVTKSEMLDPQNGLLAQVRRLTV
jgi:two-component system response regulator MprA